ERQMDDIVVFYFAGHGYTSDGQHCLCCHGFQFEDPFETGLLSSELAQRFLSGQGARTQNVWIILDTCFSGKGTAETLAEVSRITQQTLPTALGGFWALASARPKEEVQDGAFVTPFRDIILQQMRDPAFAGDSARTISPDGIVGRLNQLFETWSVAQRVL